jgi:adenine nucleotide transporter 17
MSLSKELNENMFISKAMFDSLNHGLSGALGACVTTFMLYPMENVKTRLQSLIKAKQQHEEEQKLTKTTIEEEVKQEETEIKNAKATFLDVMKTIYKEEGYQGFYKGIVPYVCGILASFGIYFFWYEFFRQRFLSGGYEAMGYIKSALFAGLIGATLANPIWVIHLRILLEKKKGHVGMLEAAKKIYHQEGPSGFFKGTKAGYILVLNPIIQFVVYEFLKKKFENSKYRAIIHFVAGAISKALATYLTYPYQTLKTILQANEHENVSIMENISNIYQKHGLGGFYKGLSAKLTQTVINSALLLVLYEEIHRFIESVLGTLLKKQ